VYAATHYSQGQPVKLPPFAYRAVSSLTEAAEVLAQAGPEAAVPAGALAVDPRLDEDPRRLDEVLASNLCRCTGYDGIRRAAISAARRMRAGAGGPG
jgi:aerobic-type carbon monoxide dehydrogenase small subunit (CoxS/CutS family)